MLENKKFNDFVESPYFGEWKKMETKTVFIVIFHSMSGDWIIGAETLKRACELAQLYYDEKSEGLMEIREIEID